MEYEEEIQDTSDQGFYSDGASWASQQIVNSTTDLNDSIEDNKKNAWPKSRPTVTLESSGSAMAEGKESCEVCKQQEADTCVVHFGGSHTSFCLDCATECYARGKFCPLCTKHIVYFYKHDNI